MGRWSYWAVRAACVALLLTGGCAVDQAKEVETYRLVIDLPAPAYEPGRPLSLRDALLLANANNENLSVEGEGYLRQLIARRRTVANFLPTLDLVGDYRLRDSSGGSGGGNNGGGGGGGGGDETFDLSAELDWELFSGFRDANRYWRDTFLIDRRRDELLAVQESLLLDVANVYYRILQAEAQVQVLENSLVLQEERLRDARGRLEAKVARPLDVAQTEAQVAATRTALIDARRAAADARSLLELLTGAPVAEAALVEAYALPESVPDIERYLEAAETSRRDLSAAHAAVAAARREVEVAWGQYYPTVSLNLSAFLSRDTTPTDRDWESLLSANLPIFAAGRIHADVREAWSFFREALLVRSFLLRQVRQQVRQAYQDLRSSDERLGELQVQLTAARQAFEQAEASYRVGLATNLERVAAQDALLEAQLQMATEEFTRKVLYLSLLRAAGRLREEVEAMPGLAADAPAERPQPMPLQGEGFPLRAVQSPMDPAQQPDVPR